MANFENIEFPFELKIKKNNIANAKAFRIKSGDPNPNVLGGRLDVANMETVKVKEIRKYSNGNILWLVVDIPNANDWKNLLTQFREPTTNIPIVEISYNNVGILKNDNSLGVAKFDDVIDVITTSATINMSQYTTIKKTPVYIHNPKPLGDGDLTIKKYDLEPGKKITITGNGELITSGTKLPILYLQTAPGSEPEFIYKSDLIGNTKNTTQPENNKKIFTVKNIVITVIIISAIYGILKFTKVIK